MEKTMGHLHDMCIELVSDDSPPLWQIKKLEFFHAIFPENWGQNGKLPLRLLFLVTWICGIFEVAEMSSMALTKRIFRMQVGGEGRWQLHSLAVVKLIFGRSQPD